MPRTRPPYPQKFRDQIIELARNGRTPSDLADEFEPTETTIRNWLKQADRDEGKTAEGLSTDEREELRELRKKLRQMKQERDILGKSDGLVRKGDRRCTTRIFRFIDFCQAAFPISVMCRVLEVSTSGYYAWRKRPPSKRAQKDAMLTNRIRQIHDHSRGTYGSPRIHAALQAEGIRVGKKRVARLMKEAGLRGISRRKRPSTTVSGDNGRPVPDLVDRDFTASRPDELWVADITYVPTQEGYLYLAVVIDAYSRKVVGWEMAGYLRSELVLEALNMATGQREPEKTIHHSDQGSQYTAIAFGERCKAEGVRPSMGSRGDCYDNAMCESFFATLECELIERDTFATKSEARLSVFEFIEGWYNPDRLHSSVGYRSPQNYEEEYRSQNHSRSEEPHSLVAA
ncbi:IS3 family transposase [Salinibacter ruber]|uniref:IS3 family transposase n=1 Tax=Salinibacter ruber TaxID=146919 RepID=UPI0021687FDA|nr:IS3 family transposase [Salinibacter ruber]